MVAKLNKARDLFLTLATSPIAPDHEFPLFVVGDRLDESFNRLKILCGELVEAKQPSRFQLVVGENGNGKTLLANRVKQFLSEENDATKEVESGSSPRRFDVLYSHISALGQPSSQTSLEIAANLRRSQSEEPEITYSLLAAEIAKNFAAQYLQRGVCSRRVVRIRRRQTRQTRQARCSRMVSRCSGRVDRCELSECYQLFNSFS